MKPNPVYKELAQLVGARQRCEATNNAEWLGKHTERIETVMETCPAHGGGFDSGTQLDLDESSEEKLVFHTSYHHMNENGMYDGWTEHTVTIRPSLAFGYRMTIGGRNRNDIKEYMHQVFECWLSDPIETPTVASV